MSTYNFSIELTYEEICTAIRIYKDAIAYHNFTLEYCKKHLLLLEETIKNRDTDIKGDKKEFFNKVNIKCCNCWNDAEIFQTEGNFCLSCWQRLTEPNV